MDNLDELVKNYRHTCFCNGGKEGHFPGCPAGPSIALIDVMTAKITQLEERLEELGQLLRQSPPQGVRAPVPSSADKPLVVTAPDIADTTRVLLDGSPVVDDSHKVTDETGMQKDYVVLQHRQNFVRPCRYTYVHEKCNKETGMNRKIAETYATDPTFYTGTFCSHCQGHFPVGSQGEFVWLDGTKVGT